ncbi:PBCV-specific basic adaptor domain-containing protein [Hydrobacter penzbergensis]|uniref:PBCV-specific basic adaptor domain-containing protein n=2 Tax=Hydrobacter penzbergensis TaxID=1235997 RepID=A0A8X8IFN4_9BACT|nr:PBCV-specific basic adaptor domain-containing protein [Hydrobacter penzbergensis]
MGLNLACFFIRFIFKFKFHNMKKIFTLSLAFALLLGGVQVFAQTKETAKEKAKKEAADKKKAAADKAKAEADKAQQAAAVKKMAPVAAKPITPAPATAKPAVPAPAPKVAAPAPTAKTADKVVGTDAKGRTIYEGPRGGHYYINKNGNKEYVKKQ